MKACVENKFSISTIGIRGLPVSRLVNKLVLSALILTIGSTLQIYIIFIHNHKDNTLEQN